MSKITINSQFTLGCDLEKATQFTVKTEPMLFGAGIDFAWDNGGPLTKHFLNAINEYGWRHEHVGIDSRVHMLMPGMWPCIPGWHHDDVPRTREDKQPNYLTPEYKSEHVMALWGDCSLTEFALGRHEIEIPPVGQKIYKTWDPEVEELCNQGKLARMRAPEATLVFFDWMTWHRGMPTTHHGFRFFIRATRHPNLKPKNEIRYNANVYMPVLEEGW